MLDFYEKYEVPKGDRMPLEKDILLLVPDAEYDTAPALDSLGLSQYEVAVTWPKPTIDMLAEICEMNPKLVIQCGQDITRKFPSAFDQEDFEALRPQVLAATADSFVCLHHHDEFSIRDGLGTVVHLVKLLKKQRRSFCCVTNHGTVGGWVKQYKTCKDAGIKPVFGFEAYVSPYRGDDPEIKKLHRKANHLLMIANTREGFDNIIQIHNDAQLNGFYYSPRVDREAIKKWGKGIVATSACMKGEIPELLMEDKEDEARDLYEFYAEHFDQFYIEIQIIECERQREVNRRLIKFAQAVGAPMMIGCDSHYLEPEHDSTHNILMCIRQGKTVMDQKVQDDIWEFDVGNIYYRNEPQVRATFETEFVEKNGPQCEPFKDDVFTEEVFAEAVANTRLIAMGTEPIVLDDTIKLPRLYPDGKKILTKKVNDGFKRRQAQWADPKFNKYLDQDGNKVTIPVQAYVDRLRYEFGIITKLGWTDYFLITERIIADAVEEYGEWVIGFGRGSGAGSVVCYCLGITDVDPLVHGLLFERFLSEDRPDPPDIDNDFDPRYREAIKKHVVELFGEKKVCSIGSYQMYRTSSVVAAVARTLGYDIHEVRQVTKKIDPLKEFEDDEGQEHKVDDMSFEDLFEHYPALKAYLDKYPDVRKHAEVLRNQVQSMSTHAGGVIISDIDLPGYVPVLYDKPGNEDRKVISAWAEAPGKTEYLSAVGLVKFDILGLNNLSVIADCLKLVEETRHETYSRAEVPIDDREAIKFASKDDLVGIFQLENPATMPVATKVGLETLGDVSALTSLIRPGPRDKGMDLEYAARKHGEPYAMPDFLRKMLFDTHGVITYQEQCMKVAQELAGFSPGDSYRFVKVIAKKLPEKMAAMKEQFVTGSQPRIDAGECTLHDVEVIWGFLETFAGYGFNRAHATAYSAVSTAELWLKHRFPSQFLCALINNTKPGKKKHGSDNIMVNYINYARRKDVRVRGPHINQSGEEFRLEKSAMERGKWDIRFSLKHVKFVASKAVVIQEAVDEKPIASIADFHARVKVTTVGKTGKTTSRRPDKRQVFSLIAAGAFDSFGTTDDVTTTRNEVLADYYKARKTKKDGEPPEHTADEWVESEREAIGLCLSREPLFTLCEQDIKDNKWTAIHNIDDRKKVKAFGRVEAITVRTSKAMNPMFIVTLGDDLNTMKFFVFKSAMELFRDNVKVGKIAAVPLDRFDDSDTRFFDDRGTLEIVDVKGVPVSPLKKKRSPIYYPMDFPHGPRIWFTTGDGDANGWRDNWKVKTNGNWYYPLDRQLFTALLKMQANHGDKVYDTCFKVFKITPLRMAEDVIPEQKIWNNIMGLATPFGKDVEQAREVFGYIYYVMMAEENKDKAQAGKRVKMLGIHQVLKDGMAPAEAADCSRGQSFPWISGECKARGF
jgi:DNA polymerase-3 subunit alpha